jgi:hypothetical protein
MSMTPPLDPLMLWLDDPVLRAALAGQDAELAPALIGVLATAPDAAPAPMPDAPPAPVPHASPAPAPEPLPVASAAATPEPLPVVAPMPAYARVPEDAFPTAAELDAMLADSYQPEPGLDAAMRAELAEALGLDPALIDDAEAFLAALLALEPPPEPPLPEPVGGDPLWDSAWLAAMPEDWVLG